MERRERIQNENKTLHVIVCKKFVRLEAKVSVLKLLLCIKHLCVKTVVFKVLACQKKAFVCKRFCM